MESSSPTGPASERLTSRVMGKGVESFRKLEAAKAAAKEVAEPLLLSTEAENVGGAIVGNVIEVWPVDPEVIEIWPVDPEAKPISRVMHNAKNSDVVPVTPEAPIAKPVAEPAPAPVPTRVSRVRSSNNAKKSGDVLDTNEMPRSFSEIKAVPVAPVAKPEAEPSPVTRVKFTPRKSRVQHNPKDATRSPNASPLDDEVEINILKIEANISLLRNLKTSSGDNFKNILSGEVSHSAPKINAPIREAAAELKRLGIEAKKIKLPEHVIDLAGNTGGYAFQVADKPRKTMTMDGLFDRYKFYLSLGSKTGDAVQLGNQERFLVDLAKTAVDRNIDISWKTMDHDYDQPCIYTSDPAELGQLLAELYQSDNYPKSMWNDSERFFQGEVEGTSNRHIGLVQEPKNGFRGDSHSGRMGQLGGLLEEAGDITPETYLEAITKTGLRPEAPGLLSDDARSEYYATVEERREIARRIFRGTPQ